MKTVFVLLSAITVLTFSSCGSGGDSSPSDSVKGDSRSMLIGQIDSLRSKMEVSKTYDAQEQLRALRLYTDFINKYPNDSLIAEYLFTASDLAGGTGNYQLAVQYLEIILNEHTDFPKYEDALFAAALVYDNSLENVNHGGERAIQLYEQIELKYPDTYYAEQAKVLKTYVGKPDSVFFNDVRRKADSIEAQKK